MFENSTRTRKKLGRSGEFTTFGWPVPKTASLRAIWGKSAQFSRDITLAHGSGAKSDETGENGYSLPKDMGSGS
ncbi:hypothetical protein, partial [Shigella flexneri]|uniref:hypothetical protein n=1 Tax=Shigella flexneri TaxID=623 RepID=UPI001C0A8BAA